LVRSQLLKLQESAMPMKVANNISLPKSTAFADVQHCNGMKKVTV
jgi:hypothetical protein